MNAKRVLVLVLAALAACGTQTGKRAGEGAATGAVAGAAGGLLTALVFGGDPVERAARGAVWGAGAGAATGAMVGAKEDSERKASEKTKREADIAQLKSKLGEDAYNGLVALVEKLVMDRGYGARRTDDVARVVDKAVEELAE